MTPNNTSTLEKTVCCPQCQSRMSLGLEETVLHLKVVNPNTGELLKRTKKRRIHNSDSRCFLICEGEDCDFLVDDEDPMYEQYFYLFKLVNEKDVDSFANEVK